MEMQEFAFKGVGIAGLTLGIIGTALAGFGGGNGCVANNNQVSSLLMEVQSEKYTD